MATQQMGTQLSPLAVIERLQSAQNQHDLEAFLECIAPDYQSEQPIHPDSAFRGRDQVRKNWSAIFSGVPDFHAELLHSASQGDTAWSEWRWSGTRVAGTRLEMRGVTIFGVRDNRIAWGRLYMEPVQEAGAGIDAQMQKWAQGSAMSAANKTLLQRFYEELFNRGELSVADEIVAEQYVNHDALPGEAPGRVGLMQFVTMLRTAIPDLQFTIEDQVAEGEKVVTRFTASGTQQEELFGIPSTGKWVKVTGTNIHRVVNGQIQEGWLNWDALGM